MKILMIAPACDGEDVGEAWVAFQWAKLAVGALRPHTSDHLQAWPHAAGASALGCPRQSSGRSRPESAGSSA